MSTKPQLFKTGKLRSEEDHLLLKIKSLNIDEELFDINMFRELLVPMIREEKLNILRDEMKERIDYQKSIIKIEELKKIITSKIGIEDARNSFQYEKLVGFVDYNYFQCAHSEGFRRPLFSFEEREKNILESKRNIKEYYENYGNGSYPPDFEDMIYFYETHEVDEHGTITIKE